MSASIWQHVGVGFFDYASQKTAVGCCFKWLSGQWIMYTTTLQSGVIVLRM